MNLLNYLLIQMSGLDYVEDVIDMFIGVCDGFPCVGTILLVG
ncbi:unnamed protein product [marine sediment metagenome]|uniref:Uncharacterized protein n=1 Tax=marine sediment metagenome TaxID=412755 RepID=X0UES6_9ZZZZ